MEFLKDLRRTHRNGDLRESDIGSEVVLMGWVHTRRDHGGCIFIDLRDREGITQVRFDATTDAAMCMKWPVSCATNTSSASLAWLRVGENVNPRMKTGAIEVKATRATIFNEAALPPFHVRDDVDVSEDLRLKYRFMDLRRPKLQQVLMLRSKINGMVRNALMEDGFLELETPILTKATPEGARDYLVPSRVHPGSCYALPRALNSSSNFLWFRATIATFSSAVVFDEDLRADRQPEFTQIDIEMAFVDEEDVYSTVERMLSRVFKAVKDIDIPTPFPRMPYQEAMDRYGSDKPDLRFEIELKDLSDLVADSGFGVFSNTVSGGGVVKAVVLPGGGLSRSKIDKELAGVVKVYGAKGLAWIKIENGEWGGPIAEIFGDAEEGCHQRTSGS